MLASPITSKEVLMHRFNVPDMTCGHCARKITAALKSADPEARIEVSLGEHLVRIDSALTGQEIAQCLAEAGYSTQAV